MSVRCSWRRTKLAARRPRTASLATRIVSLTLGVVGATILLASALAMAGVYGLSRSETAVHLGAYRQIILDDLTARLNTAERVIDSVAAALGSHPPQVATMSRTLASAAVSNIESFELLAVTDTSGTVVTRYPSVGAPIVVPSRVVSEAVGPGGFGTVFVSDRTANARVPEVWLAQSFDGGDRRLLLVGKMRSGFAQRLVNDVANRAANRSAAIIGRTGKLVAMGSDGPQLDVASVRFDEPSATAGKTEGLTCAGIGRMDGYWARLTAAPGLQWRVLVAEPSNASLTRTRFALFPASLVVLVMALVTAWLSSLFARRVVEPLHAFEARAREVASGNVARPLEVDRDDELGRLADAFNAMLVRLNALRELSGLLARSTRLDEVLRGTLSATARLLGTDVVPAVFLLDESGTRLELAALPQLPGVPPDLWLPADAPAGPARALRSDVPVSFSRADIDASSFEAMRALWDAGVRSALALRLAVGDEPLGVLVALSFGDRWFSEAERDMLGAFAAQAALAIGNSRLFEEEMRSRREAEALRDVAEELESTPDLHASLDRVATIAASLLGASSARVVLSSERAFGLGSGDGETFRRWDVLFDDLPADDPHAPVVLSGPDAARAPGFDGSRPLMLVPLVQAGSRRGVLILTCGRPDEGFSERQSTLAATIGREISLALENAYLLHQARGRAINLETIFRISQAVSSSLQSTVVLNRVLDVVQKIFSAEAVSLMTFEPAKHTIVTAMARGFRDRDMLYFETAPGEDLPGQVFESGQAEVFRGLEKIDTPLARAAAAAGFGSALAVPLLARARSTGVLTVYAAGDDAFDPGDVELLQTFASQAALAIDTAQLYGREHRVASVLQASILPESLPAVAGLDIASVYRPAAQEAEIGGDYYDVFPAPDGRVVLVIGDVAGKGVFAATKTSMVRYALRGMVAAGLGPASALTELNRMVADSGDASEIVTVWVGFLDREERTLTFADAGHPPALLFQPATEAVVRLMPTGPVLGAVARAAYREERVGMEEAAVLILYTDGVTEARGKGKFFGEGRIRRVLRGGGSAERTAERLMAAVDRFAGGRLRDDAAVLVVRLSGEGPR